jgi:hypothetical protein
VDWHIQINFRINYELFFFLLYIIKNMGGGLMQLVAYGAQDIYLTGNPQITFFKVVYRRHTNFAMESIKQSGTGSAKVPATGTNDATFTISRNGDLVHRMYAVAPTTTSADVNANAGAALLQEVSVEIGGQQIDKHYAQWLEVYAELTEYNPTGHTRSATDIDGGTNFQNMSCMGGTMTTTGTSTVAEEISVPLQFWFCRNPGLALPLIALQYHEVKVVMKIGGEDVLGTGLASDTAVDLWVDYIYLDTDERRRFAQVSHEYLIEQLQKNTLSATKSNTLTFNHPVKELVWTAGTSDDVTPAKPNSSESGTWKLVLNGQDRMASRRRNYFTRTQVWQHHTGFGGVTTRDSIAVYSFALKPEEHQPSGTCNFSRIDNAQLVCSENAVAGNVYAVNYNVLRIMSGMGGLAYSN